MQELESPVKVKQDVQLIAEVQKEYTLKDRMKRVKGLILFAVYPMRDYEVQRVVIKSTAALDINTKESTAKHQAAYDPEAFYVYAINEKRAAEKIRNQILAYIEKTRDKELNGGKVHLEREEPIKLVFHKLR